jgi:hypothetical protein
LRVFSGEGQKRLTITLKPLSADVYEHIVTPNFDRIAGGGHCGIGQELAVGNVKLPSVPGASHHLTIQVAFAQRAALMQAYVVDCKEFACHIGEGDAFFADLKFLDGSYRHIIPAGRADECHFSPLFGAVNE